MNVMVSIKGIIIPQKRPVLIPDSEIEEMLPAAAVRDYWNVMMEHKEPEPWALRVLAFNFGVQEATARARLTELGLISRNRKYGGCNEEPTQRMA